MHTAYFVRHPRVLSDLITPHLLNCERPFEIKKTIYLSKIDYENFYTDMVADRQFIEDYGYLCCAGTPMKCLLVKTRQASDGILVVPEEKCYVGWAAYLAKDE